VRSLIEVLMRWRRWLLAVCALAAAWAIAVAITGGFVLRLGSIRLSSRRWHVAALVALVCAVAAWVSSTPVERREAWGRVRNWRHWPRWLDAALALALAGIGLRIVLWAAGRPLWLDEEMIALNVRDRGFTELGGALWLGQTAPLGWLLLERATLVAWGTGERALRVAPLAFGIGTIATALWAGHRWMNRLGAAVLVGLCSFSPWLIYHSVELKPYSADAFWGLLLPVLAVWAMDAAPGASPANTRRLILWWAVAAIGHWLANGALLVTPACAVLLCVVCFHRDGWQGAARAAMPGLLWLASFGLHYALAIRETLRSDYLADYWAFAMPPVSASVTDRLVWVASRLESLAVNPGSTRLWVMFWLVAAGGFALGSHRVRGAMMAAVPLSAFALAALRIVPLFERLSIWALPAIYVGIALAVDRASQGVPGAVARRRWMSAALGLSLAAAGLWVAADVVRQGAEYLRIDLDRYARDDNHQLDDRAAIEWLLRQHRPGDVLITTELAQPAIWWYGKVPMTADENAGRQLPDGSPIVVVGFEAARVECPANELREALSGRQRALVYLGFRFDDVPKGFDGRLLSTLSELGLIVTGETFSSAGRVVVVDLGRRRPDDATPSGPGEGPTAQGRVGCLTIREARRW
jgi:hypothetical protein